MKQPSPLYNLYFQIWVVDFLIHLRKQVNIGLLFCFYDFEPTEPVEEFWASTFFAYDGTESNHLDFAPIMHFGGTMDLDF
jgi:hypothetical protein